MIFYLGTHEPSWLRKPGGPLFVSHRRLARLKTMPRARRRWALDSGGFSELSLYGRWETSAPAYAGAVRRYIDEIGSMDWASIQDWMCEPFMLEKTGLTIQEHQQRTINNYLDLKSLDSEIPWTPVLQGWALRDYIDHIEAYERSGVDLFSQKIVGVGSVCRRQGTREGIQIFRELAALGLSLHGFGLKTLATRHLSDVIASADSMAWSFAARRRRLKLPGCRHACCQNCIIWAERWRSGLADEPRQLGFRF